mgnify:CR=1 FL=1
MVGYAFPTAILLLGQMPASLASDHFQWLLYPLSPYKICIGRILAGYLDILTDITDITDILRMNNEQCRV